MWELDERVTHTSAAQAGVVTAQAAASVSSLFKGTSEWTPSKVRSDKAKTPYAVAAASVSRLFKSMSDWKMTKSHQTRQRRLTP